MKALAIIVACQDFSSGNVSLSQRVSWIDRLPKAIQAIVGFISQFHPVPQTLLSKLKINYIEVEH